MTGPREMPPVFIVGGPRCGTTLAARILNNHPRLFMPGETHFFDDIYSKRDGIGDIRGQGTLKRVHSMLSDMYARYNEPQDQARVSRLLSDVLSLPEFESRCRTYKDVFDYFMRAQMEYEGKERWGNNTPRDLYNVDDILRFYPDAKFIVCVRDVRDFMLSYKDKWKRESGGNARRLKRLYHPVITALQWKSMMRLALSLPLVVHENNLVYVRYEDIVTAPEDIVRKICSVIGEDYHPRMLDVVTNNSSSERGRAGIFTTSVGRWKGRLPDEEAYLGQMIGKNEMTRLGYTICGVKPDLARLAVLVIGAPFGFLRAVVANKDKRGPLIPYLVKRIKPFLGIKD